MSVPDWVEIANKLATPAITAISAFYIYLQYQRAQRWKGSDLSASLLAQLQSDEELSLACRALDWGIGPLMVPERYRPLMNRPAAGQHGAAPRLDSLATKRPPDTSEVSAIMDHDTALLRTAMEPDLNWETLKDPRGLIYRYCFDRFLIYLDNCYRLLKTSQISPGDIGDLKYWIGYLAKYPYPAKGCSGAEVFQPFMARYEYDGVVELGRLLGVDDWKVFESMQRKPQRGPAVTEH